jgi:hypothetical protein
MDLDTRINNLYRNRALLIFTHGRQWFIDQVNPLFAWGESECPPGMDPAVHAYMNSHDFHRHAWESDNGYYKTEDLFPGA